MPLTYVASCDQCGRQQPITPKRDVVQRFGELSDVPAGWLLAVVMGDRSENTIPDGPKPILCSWGCMAQYADHRAVVKPSREAVNGSSAQR